MRPSPRHSIGSWLKAWAIEMARIDQREIPIVPITPVNSNFPSRRRESNP
jgi:hypothetical protein